MAAVDMFLKLDGIDGESTDEQHIKWIEIETFNWAVSNPTTIGSATSGAGAGKAVPGDFVVVMPFSSASPQIFKKCVTGDHYQTAALSMRKAGGDQRAAGQEFLKYNFGTVFTTKIEWGGSGDEGPEESITFVYGSLQVQYYPQKPDGSLGDLVVSGFDFIKNVELTQ
jgi:type VI secretion system secreted protein Hcp